MEHPLLPGFRRYQADIFTRQIDAGLASQAQLGGVVRDAIDTQQLSDVIKIDVTRMDDGVVQIHFAMRRFLGIMENAPVKFSVPWAEHLETRGNRFGFEHRRGHEYFED